MAQRTSTSCVGGDAKALAFGFLAAGFGKIAIGGVAAVLLATAIGAVVGYSRRGVAGVGLGAIWGAKSAAIGTLIEGSTALLLAYCIAGGLAAICFAEFVYSTWRNGIEQAQAAYEDYLASGCVHCAASDSEFEEFDSASRVEIAPFRHKKNVNPLSLAPDPRSFAQNEV
jgi:hypothetical protein